MSKNFNFDVKATHKALLHATTPAFHLPGSSQSSGILSTETNSNPSSRISALTFFLSLTEMYSRTPLFLRFFFLAMALSVYRSSRPAVVMNFLFDLLDRLRLLGRLDLVFLCGLLCFCLDRTEFPVVRLFASSHLLLDSFKALGDQA